MKHACAGRDNSGFDGQEADGRCLPAALRRLGRLPVVPPALLFRHFIFEMVVIPI
jgi:hypothetical protein